MKHLLQKLRLLIAIFCVYSFPSYANQDKPYVVLGNPYYSPGMFSVLTTLAGILDRYDTGQFAGVEVDFEEQGLYYDPAHGLNWWKYYFEPMYLGDARGAPIKKFTGPECCDYARHAEFTLPKERIHTLITKYIRLQPEIQKELRQFKRKNFKRYRMIGVHYRGTDKISEAPRLAYEDVVKAIKNEVKTRHLKSECYRIFVATDEQAFIDFIKTEFPQHIICQKAIRSEQGQALHMTNSNHYQHGKEALLDSLLLAECDLLIRTSSNLSLWSTYFNPDMPVINLTNRY